jgi:hypothetical protein
MPRFHEKDRNANEQQFLSFKIRCLSHKHASSPSRERRKRVNNFAVAQQIHVNISERTALLVFVLYSLLDSYCTNYTKLKPTVQFSLIYSRVFVALRRNCSLAFCAHERVSLHAYVRDNES